MSSGQVLPRNGMRCQSHYETSSGFLSSWLGAAGVGGVDRSRRAAWRIKSAGAGGAFRTGFGTEDVPNACWLLTNLFIEV